MVAQTTLDLRVLEDAQDIFVIRPRGKDDYVFAAKTSLDFQRATYQESIANPDDANVPAFNGHWQFDDQVGIRGSSTFLALRYDKRALRPRELWLPRLLEAKALDSQGKLENGVYRDYNLTVYSDGNPNKQVAQTLIPQAKKLGLDLPLVLPFMVLDYSANKEVEHGANISLVENPRGVISGKDAKEAIDSLDYKTNSGVHRLNRYRDGDWVAYWYNLVDSYDNGRVDWICGEATAQILKDAYSALLERTDAKEIRELEIRRQEKLSRFEASLKQ